MSVCRNKQHSVINTETVCYLLPTAHTLSSLPGNVCTYTMMGMLTLCKEAEAVFQTVGPSDEGGSISGANCCNRINIAGFSFTSCSVKARKMVSLMLARSGCKKIETVYNCPVKIH